MSKIYIVEGSGKTRSMRRVHCKNEDKELQSLLEMNLDLLPGDQINPEDPRRWIMIQREMPVADPSTGDDRWSIDFVVGDQDAIPTFIECKRFLDTRSRREVIGQMFDYAANGHHYWDKNQLLDCAKQSADALQYDLEVALSQLTLESPDTSSVDDYFERMQENLREGQLRLVFFLEDSSYELRSIVDFLNKQMERTEVLLVEARQYEHEGKRIVVPALFGYTEEARMVKRTVTVNRPDKRRQWDKPSFIEDAQQKLSAAESELALFLLDRAAEIGYQIAWGKGAANASFSLKKDNKSMSAFTISTNKRITVNLDYVSENEAFKIQDLFETKLGIHLKADGHPSVLLADLLDKEEQIAFILKEAISLS